MNQARGLCVNILPVVISACFTICQTQHRPAVAISRADVANIKQVNNTFPTIQTQQQSDYRYSARIIVIMSGIRSIYQIAAAAAAAGKMRTIITATRKSASKTDRGVHSAISTTL